MNQYLRGLCTVVLVVVVEVLACPILHLGDPHDARSLSHCARMVPVQSERREREHSVACLFEARLRNSTGTLMHAVID